MDNFDLVSSLHALPETDPIEVDGIQFGGNCGSCNVGCLLLSLQLLNTVCVGVTC
jgi:hypothetical protein